MRIMHLCLAAFYVDNFGYQENILPKMHKLLGHNVEILASTETILDNNQLGYVLPGKYINEDGIPVTRIPYVKYLPIQIAKKIRKYVGVYSEISRFKPDIIFIHNAQFVSVSDVIQYVQQNEQVTIYVDGHSDFINSARGWISRYVLHGVIYKRCLKAIEPYTRRFYGVLPARVDFFTQMYGIPKSKTELLMMGVDDLVLQEARKKVNRQRMMTQLGIHPNAKIIITGGKFSKEKPVKFLCDAVEKLDNYDVTLLIFGRPDLNYEDEFFEKTKSRKVRYLGWLDTFETYSYFLMSDLAIFTETHSVLWEQAAGTGLPCILRKWAGIQHIDKGGNCVYIQNNRVEDIYESLEMILKDSNRFEQMKVVANNVAKQFSYAKIAEYSIRI